MDRFLCYGRLSPSDLGAQDLDGDDRGARLAVAAVLPAAVSASPKVWPSRILMGKTTA
jgi:hypothetical protein